MLGFLNKFLDSNEKEIKRLKAITQKINSLEVEIKALSDEELKAKTAEFKLRLGKNESLNEILPEAFAVVRESAGRNIGERHFDVQLIAGIVLHEGKIAEQKTGEGKTLTASLPLYLNALSGKGTHLVTVNDYLARVGCGWMGPIYHSLGLTVSAIMHEQSFIYDPEFSDEKATDWRLKFLRPISRKEAYNCDITYGTNNEFGFDYLRDNMVSEMSQLSQRGHNFAIVDEVDSILIDEARTPLIISAPDTEPTSKYYDFAKLVEKLNSQTDFTIDEKFKTAALTEHGIAKVEKILGVDNLYEKDFESIHHIENALRAKTIYHKDKDYVVKDNEIVIVDEFTGRLMFGRRWSEGLHQAVEAKEGVVIQQESRTLATISFQNYFRMYKKLSGMTGTAATESEEFHKIYKLEVVIIPTNRPMVRIDNPDLVYKTTRAKYAAVVRDIEDHYKKGQPVLLGTTSIEKNVIVSEFLKRKGINHEVLNAKNHEREASIITDAGKKGAVTIATNIAGRGVDIILGGSPPNKFITTDKKQYDKEFKEWQKTHDEVVALGGLHVIGTERHESRRIDNQLRGRAGRQGDPGSSRFFVSLEDDIMRLFGGDQVSRIMTMLKMPEDQPIEHSMVSKAIEQAQVKVEGFNFDARKHLVEYDDIANKQREIIYKQRRKILETSSEETSLKDEILSKLSSEIANITALYAPEGYTEPEREKIANEFVSIVPFDEASQKQILSQLMQLHTGNDISEFLTKLIADIYSQREKQLTPPVMRQIERWVMLSVIDNLWMDHLDAMDDLREGIGLRGYGQRDPLVEYKSEAFAMFEKLMGAIDYEVSRRIFRVQVQGSPPPMPEPPKNIIETGGSIEEKTTTKPVSSSKKLGRNDPCWCGSGKKWKKCHYPQYG